MLIENVGFERLERLLPEPIGLETLKRRWLASAIVRRFELGQITPQVFARELVDDWRLDSTADDFLAEFAGWPRGFYPGALDLLTRLRRGYRIGCLTNSNALHWERFNGFDGLFDVALSSHRIGLIKPDPACFAHAIASCGHPGGEILYLDDARPNVDAARLAGLDAVHVEGCSAVLDAVRTRHL